MSKLNNKINDKITRMSFGDITFNDIQFTLKLVKTNTHQWLKTDFELPKSWQTYLGNLSKKYIDTIDMLNEQELVVKYISPILSLVDFSGRDYNTFFERDMNANIDGIELFGRVDMVVARGVSTPINPYFFIQEYKRFQLGPKSDPLSQLLGEMLVANTINKNSKCFGCYIVGRFWYFVILENKNYTILEPLDSINLQDLEIIFTKLQAVKEYIENINPN
jgi:hypothetical protein